MNRYVGRFPGNFHYVIIAQVCKSGFVRRRPRMRCPLVCSASLVWSASSALERLVVLADARFRILSHSRHGFGNMQVFICIAFNIMLERLPVSAASLAHALERCARR
jgi:hypothetical protein